MFKMMIGFIIRETTDHCKLYSKKFRIFLKNGMGAFFNKLDGYDDQIALCFAQNSEHTQKQEPHNHQFHTIVKGLIFFVDEDIISRLTKIPRGQPWDKVDRALYVRTKTSFFKFYEEYEENQNGVK